jgi:hypothetical protein
MKRVLLVGLDPATVDFSDPALPPGMTAEKIHAGVKLTLADMAGRGWQAENCFVNPDETAVPTVERRLAMALKGAQTLIQAATRSYSCSRPPRRSRRHTSVLAVGAVGASWRRPAGVANASPRCGR